MNDSDDYDDDKRSGRVLFSFSFLLLEHLSVLLVERNNQIESSKLQFQITRNYLRTNFYSLEYSMSKIEEIERSLENTAKKYDLKLLISSNYTI